MAEQYGFNKDLCCKHYFKVKNKLICFTNVSGKDAANCRNKYNTRLPFNYNTNLTEGIYNLNICKKFKTAQKIFYFLPLNAQQRRNE